MTTRFKKQFTFLKNISILILILSSCSNEKNQNYATDLKKKKTDHWKISDESNTDQLKAITGFCFTVGILTIVGLYSNLM